MISKNPKQEKQTAHENTKVLITEESNCTKYSLSSENIFLKKNPEIIMSLNTEHVQYILARFTGIRPRQILEELQYRAYLPWINIATVERCLCENGCLLIQEIPTTPSSADNHQGGSDRLGPSITAATQNEARHQNSPITTSPAAAAAVGTFFEIDNLLDIDDPGPTLSWDSLAEKFAISAYRGGKSEDDIWVTLRRYGYDITRPEVVASLIRQGISGAR